MSGDPVCPECNAPVAPDDFQCGQCELLLNPEVASGEYIISEPTIVRAMLAPPQRSPTEAPPRPPEARTAVHDMATAVFTVPMDAYTVPRLSAGVNIALSPLQPFEAYVASFVDGVQPVPELARAARLPEIEVQVVLKALLERRVVELHRQPRPPALPPSEAPLPVGQFLLGDEEPVALGEEPPAVPVSRRMVKPPTPPAQVHTFLRPAAPAPSQPPPAPVQAKPAPSPAPAAPPAPAGAKQAPASAAKPAAAPAKPAPASKPAAPTKPAPAVKPAAAQAKPAPSAKPAAKPAAQAKPAPAPKPVAAKAPPAPAPPAAPASAPVEAQPPATPAPVEPPPAPVTVSAPPAAAPQAPAAPSRAETPAQDEDFLQAAIRLERAGNVDGAIEVLKRALEGASAPAALYNKLALVLINQRKDYGQAATLLERAVELEPHNSVFQQNLRKVAGLAASRSGPR